MDRAFDLGNAVLGPTLAELEEIYNKPLEKWTFINTFTPVIADKYTEIRNAVNELKKAGCCYAEMSGSGSTFFVLEQKLPYKFDTDKYEIFENLELI